MSHDAVERFDHLGPCSDGPYVYYEDYAKLRGQIAELQRNAARYWRVVDGIANANRFDRDTFADDTEFVNWAISICRHAAADTGGAAGEHRHTETPRETLRSAPVRGDG
jgi:hypothetical protein